MFLDKFANLSTAYTGQFNLQLMLLSLIVATLSIYIGFRVAERMHMVRKISSWVAHFWWLGGALILGAGFWSLYFIGLLAYSLPVETSIDIKRALLYLVPAVLGSGLVLHIRKGIEHSPARQWTMIIGLGLGVGLMQYGGITALQANADLKFDAAWCSLTVIVAIGLAWFGLNIKWRYEANGIKRLISMPALLVASLALGVASMAVQHTAMHSMYFFPLSDGQVPEHWLMQDPNLASWTVASIVLIFSLMVYLVVRHGLQLAMTAMLDRGIEDTLKSLADSAEGIITTDSWGTIKSFNQAAEELFGYPAARVLGENCLCLIPGRIVEAYQSKLTAAGPGLSSLINRTHSMEFRKADGSEFQGELVISPLSRRNRLEFVGMIRDNSAIKAMESDKDKYQKKLEFLLQASPVTIYSRELSRGFPFSYVSPNVRNLLGHEAGDITTSHSVWAELVHPEDLEIYTPSIRVLNGGDANKSNVEYRLMSPDGSYRWISDTRHLVVDDLGRPSLIIGCWRDIHERKETALHLELNRERLNISLKHARMATWDWVIGTGEVIWSEDMQEKLGLSNDKAASFQNFINIVHPDDRAAVKAAFKQSLLSDKPFDMEYRILWPDQSIHWLHSAGGLISDAKGNPTHMVGVLHEIEEPMKLHAVSNQVAYEREVAVS